MFSSDWNLSGDRQYILEEWSKAIPKLCPLNSRNYGSRCWNMTELDLKHLSTFHAKYLQNLMRIFLPLKNSQNNCSEWPDGLRQENNFTSETFLDVNSCVASWDMLMTWNKLHLFSKHNCHYLWFYYTFLLLSFYPSTTHPVMFLPINNEFHHIQCMGSSAVSDVHFRHFSYSLHQGIDSATTLYCHIL